VRIVLDTNVLVAGLLSAHAAPARVLQSILAGEVSICYDSRIVAEYRQVLARPKFAFDQELTEDVIDWIEVSGELLIPPPLSVSLPDPDDVMFLEVAVAANVDCLVTGNLRHFPQRRRHGVSVLKPMQFVEWY
jgi:putative PIN family toxin of toxin-antitoxin system